MVFIGFVMVFIGFVMVSIGFVMVFIGFVMVFIGFAMVFIGFPSRRQCFSLFLLPKIIKVLETAGLLWLLYLKNSITLFSLQF